MGNMARTLGIGKQDFEKYEKKMPFISIKQNLFGNGGKARMM